MSLCTDNHRLGLIGCAGRFTGNAGHCVAKVPWSTHGDGRAHVTFSSDDAARIAWEGGTLRDPATVVDKYGRPRLEQDSRGYWRRRREVVSEEMSAATAGNA